MKGQYTHYLVIPNTSQGLDLRITSRYDWQTFTYTEVERTGTREVQVELPITISVVYLPLVSAPLSFIAP